jgi:hypothetical protein
VLLSRADYESQPDKLQVEFTKQMDKDLQRRLTNRYRRYNRNRPKHPDVPPQGPGYDLIHDKYKIKKEQFKLIRRRPHTVKEVQLGWEGLVAFMDFFGGDKQLAADACNVSLATIARMIRIGYVTPYVALCAQDIETMPWTPAGLCRYIEYEYQWDKINSEYCGEKSMRRMLKERGKRPDWSNLKAKAK